MSESEYQIRSTSEASPQDVQAVLTGLRGYNEMHAGPAHFTAVHLLLHDSQQAVRGGLLGKQLWGWLYVDSLWVEESLRGHGWGRRLLRQAEAEGQQAGCTRALLDTFDFQARPFYEREGYTIFGVLEGFPPGHRRYYMQKELVPDPSSEMSSDK
jgi:GNAT superfamily N-acetyltransferase